ncbi:MAG: hypothetical protein Q9195_008875 [Heterodermia aff. obscurata]
MFARDIDSALDYERISSPNLAAVHRTRSSDSLIAASDISELSDWSEAGSSFVVDPLSSRGSVSEDSLRDYEWAVIEERTRQSREAKSVSAYYAGKPRPEGLDKEAALDEAALDEATDREARLQNSAIFSADRNPFGCQGLHPGIPYLTPPADGYEDDNTEDLHLRGGGHDSLDLDQDVADSIVDAAKVFTHDPCQKQENKGFKLPFFSRKKPSAPKPAKQSSKLSLGIRLPSVPSVPKLLGKRPDPARETRENPIREPNTDNICLGRKETPEFFFDQQEEQKKSFVRFSNASTATLALESVEDMQTLNDALPISRL